MSLFKLKEPLDAGPARNAEPHYMYLCRSGRTTMSNCRSLIDQWYTNYPSAHQADLRERLTGRDDVHFEAAFFELYLHELFRRLGYQVEVHPSAGATTKPDFLLRTNGKEEAYVEAIVASDKTDTQRAAEARINAVYDTVNAMKCPDFFIALEIGGLPATPPPAKKFRDSIARDMASLDVVKQAALLRSSGIGALPRFSIQHDGCDVTYYFIPKSEDARGKSDTQPIGMYMPKGASWIDSRRPLLNAITKKASRYGDLDKPYLIAVNTMGFPLQRKDVLEALFGKEQVTVFFNSDDIHSHQMGRRPDGAFTTFGGPRSTRVSGVLHVSTLFPWSVASMDPVLYHNPYARYQYEGLLDQLPCARGIDGEMKWLPGIHARDIFELDAAWPGRHED